MVVIDATTLMLLLRPEAGVPVGPKNAPIHRPKERLEFLIAKLEKSRTTIVIPAPVLSEVLVRVEPSEAHKLVEKISSFSIFRIEPFDVRAAIEVASMTRNAIDGGNKPKRRSSQATWAKLKYDRQVVATALVTQAMVIYSDDRDIRAIAKRAGIQVIGIADLELPPEDAQQSFRFLQLDAEESDGDGSAVDENPD